MRVAVLFDNLGPYHIARLRAFGNRVDLLAVELRHQSLDYDWPSTKSVPFRTATLFNETKFYGRQIRTRLFRTLTSFRPQVVVVPGWTSAFAEYGALWSIIYNVPIIVMSDSQLIDAKRYKINEWFKARFLACCSGALVAGTTHKQYLIHLGFPCDKIEIGYDVVDNEYFEAAARCARKRSHELRETRGLPKLFFLAAGRLVPKKNFENLLLAFRIFRDAGPEAAPWHLVLAGDGPLRRDIEQVRDGLGLQDCVVLTGSLTYQELALHYGLAKAFILASMVEQWGLVVNEAMAAGLPVLVSNRAGASADLVIEGRNGWTFDASQPNEIAAMLTKMARLDAETRAKMSVASGEIIAAWSLEMFAKNLEKLCFIALEAGSRGTSGDRLVLRFMATRQAHMRS